MPSEARKELRPFEEALAFHRKRAGISSKAFYALSADGRRRAFTVSGGLRQSAILEVHRLVEKALAEGQTKHDFAQALGELLDREGIVLPRTRLGLIWQNNYAVAYGAGRYQKMNTPALLKTRPYRQYPKGPHDARTSRICLALEGLVWKAGDPIEARIWPPNHHHERHLDVLSLTPEQAKATGRIYEPPPGGKGADGYPVVNGQEIRPDAGWDFDPSLTSGDLPAMRARAAELGEPQPAKTFETYGLSKLKDLTPEPLPKGAAPATVEDAAELLREQLGVAPGATQALTADYAGDAVVVALDEEGLALLAFPEPRGITDYVIPTLASPAEVWATPHAAPAGTVVTKRYIGTFERKGGEREATLLERGPDGLLLRARPATDRDRRGWLIRSRDRETKT